MLFAWRKSGPSIERFAKERGLVPQRVRRRSKPKGQEQRAAPIRGAVGAVGLDNSEDAAGAAYVFTKSGATWAQQAYLKSADTAAGDDFGGRVAVSADGNTVAVSATRELSYVLGDGAKQGSTYIFHRSNATWNQLSNLGASNGSGNNAFGSSVAISADGETVLAGADCESSNATGIDGNQLDQSAMCAGAAYLFANVTNGPIQTAYIKASNTSAGATFGIALAMTPDTATLAISATAEKSAAVGIDGDQHDMSAPFAGATYVFH